MKCEGCELELPRAFPYLSHHTCDDTRTLHDVNTTVFARHYEAATGILLWALAEPSGETFAYAHAEAMRAHDAAAMQHEQLLAESLARNISDTARVFGYRLRDDSPVIQRMRITRDEDRMNPSNPQFGQWR